MHKFRLISMFQRKERDRIDREKNKKEEERRKKEEADRKVAEAAAIRG